MFWISELRFIAAIAVIILHVSASYIPNLSENGNSLIIINLYESLVRWCVPIFVIITGFLLNNNTATNLADFYRKRVKRILLPLIFWTLFYLIWIFAKSVILGREHNILDALISILEGRPYYHLWYIYMIIGIYFFAPLMNIVINKLTLEYSLNFIAIIFFLAFASVLYNVFVESKSEIFLLMFLKFIPFYMFGALLRKYDGLKLKQKSLYILSIICAVGIFLSFLQLNNIWGMDVAFIAYNYNSTLVVIMSLSLFYIFKQRRKPLLSGSIFDFGNSKALGVYLIHPIFLDVFNYFGVFDTSFMLILAIPTLSLLTFGFALFACFLLSKLTWFNKIV